MAYEFEPIAIIGDGCVLPGALDPDALWELIRDGRDVVADAPTGYWGVADDSITTTPEAAEHDRTWSRRGGYVSGFDSTFDARGFAVEPSVFEGLDPLFSWTAYAARQAIQRAGYEIGSLRRGGVVLGNLSYPTRGMADHAASVWTGEGEVDPRNRFMSGLPAHLVAQAVGFDLEDVGAFAQKCPTRNSGLRSALKC